MGTTIHGSVHCTDQEGGPTMKLPEETTHGRYAEIVELLIKAGARLPNHAGGSDAVAEVLRRHGVLDAD